MRDNETKYEYIEMSYLDDYLKSQKTCSSRIGKTDPKLSEFEKKWNEYYNQLKNE